MVKMMNNHGKGNRKAQNKRKRQRMKHLPKKQDEKFQLYDGNFSYYPFAYCKRYGAYLSKGLADTHKCIERNCNGFEML